jgi:tetratricopeptide (TPR) repeat protein
VVVPADSFLRCVPDHGAVYIRANMTRIGSFLFVGFSIVVLAGSALADKPLSKTAKEKAAKKACAMGDFQKGADILTDLFIETNDTTYVYNQGRCYQQNNRWEQAISRFREFLRKAKDLSESDRIDTERQIADCEASLAKIAPPPVAPPPPVPVTHVETPQPSPASEPAIPDVSTTPAPPPSDSSRGKGLRVTGIVLAAVGVAAIGTGVGLALNANGLSTKDYSQSREDERASLKTWGFVSYGVGAAAIATGAILYLVGRPSEESSSVALLPALAPDGASMLFKGSF